MKYAPLYALTMLFVAGWCIAWRALGGDPPLHGYNLFAVISLSLNEGPIYAAVTMIQAVAIPAIAIPIARRWRLDATLVPLLKQPLGLACVLGCIGTQISLLLAWSPLESSPITPDERVLLLQADLLRHAQLSFPSPAFAEAFTQPLVVTSGVLPAGHWTGALEWAQPALLALGQALGARMFVGPLEALATIVFGAALAGELSARDGRAPDPRGVLIGAALLTLSPVVVLTGATMLDANLAGVCAAATFWALARLRRGPSTPALIALALAVSIGVHAHPFDEALVLLGGSTFLLLPSEARARDKALRLTVALLGALPACLLALWIHRHLFGAPFITGRGALNAVEHKQTFGIAGFHTRATAAFKAFTASTHLLVYTAGSAWLFLFPLPRLLGVGDGAQQARIRLLGPLIPIVTFVVGYTQWSGVQLTVTGPVNYVGIVPMLSAWIAANAVDLHDRARAFAPIRRIVPATLVAATVTSLVLFWPSQLMETVRTGEASNACQYALEKQGIHDGLIFLAPARGTWVHTWIDAPPMSSPRFDDRVLWVRSIDFDNDALLAARYGHGRPIYALNCLLDAQPHVQRYNPWTRSMSPLN